MSTTVTYKGQTLTTVENQTKTLQTAGTWVEGDFTLTDVTQGGGSGDALYKLLDKTITDSDIDWSQVTAVKDWGFYQCGQLTSVSNPVVRSLPGNGFRNCTGLTSAEITGKDQLQTYCGSMFRSDTALQTATIHFAYSGNNDVDFGDNYVFSGCSNLQTVIFTHSHATKTLKVRANWMFEDCTLFRNLVLKTTNMVTLTNGVNANAWGGLWNNPTESKIYVPSALISAYQTATNWSTLYNHGISFVAIEGSEFDD